ESIVKFLDVTNTGSLDFTYVMESTATTSSSLNTDATNGLQLEIKHCTAAWSGNDTCAGGTASTKYTGRLGPMSGSPVNLGTVTAGAGNVAHLQIRVTLPSSAGSLTGQTSTLQFTWTATNT
ncbi:MAG TPA: hypothetical protein VGW38_10690, partial [Chloroflexota bacterium]|nr:hypothetical protein [Chloroflexota bacterium]